MGGMFTVKIVATIISCSATSHARLVAVSGSLAHGEALTGSNPVPDYPGMATKRAPGYRVRVPSCGVGSGPASEKGHPQCRVSVRAPGGAVSLG